MKKFLIGIVTLVAAVMFTSPAFGALANPVDLSGAYGVNGIFTFENGAEVAKLGNPGKTIEQDLLDAFGPYGLTEIYYDKYEDPEVTAFYTDDGEGKSGLINFDPAVNVIVAKWATNTFGFYIPEMTETFKWEDLDNAMSHVGYNAVPVPAAVWLLGSGVLGLVAIRRRRS